MRRADAILIAAYLGQRALSSLGLSRRYAREFPAWFRLHLQRAGYNVPHLLHLARGCYDV